jgi:hypothetical protein
MSKQFWLRTAGLGLIIAAAIGAGMISSAQAMPGSPIAAESGLLTQVAGGCGPGWHRGPYGGCRKNYANPAAHPCPRGYYLGRFGRCRANGT